MGFVRLKPTTLCLKSNGWDLELSPENGAAILKCRYSGQDILRPYTDDIDNEFEMLNSGGFCLVPFSNRIADGTFTYGGKTAAFGLTHDNIRPHPIHGFGWRAPWDVVDTNAKSMTLQHEQTAGDWPWAYHARQHININEDGLHHELSVKNLSDTAMPAGLGFHPFFPDRANAELCSNAEGVWHTRGDGIPTRHSNVPQDWKFKTGKALAGTNIDHVFTGAGSVAEITWRNAPKGVRLKSCRRLSYAVIYTGSDDNSFCYEPVTHMTDAVNRQNANEPSGLIDLAPGDTETVSMTYTII